MITAEAAELEPVSVATTTSLLDATPFHVRIVADRSTVQELTYLAIAWMLGWAVILGLTLADHGLSLPKAMIPVLLSIPAGLLAHKQHRGARVIILFTALVLAALSIVTGLSVGLFLFPAALLMLAAVILGPRKSR